MGLCSLPPEPSPANDGGMALQRVDLAILCTILLVALVGALDAAIAVEPDLMALMVIVAALAVGLLVRNASGRRTMTVRADLARWVRRREALTGESPDALVDRALAVYRVQLGEATDDQHATRTTTSMTCQSTR
jgi:hypothetical protein